MSLLRADLTVLANLPRTPAGRRLLFAAAFGLGILALMWWSMSYALLENRALLRQLHLQTGGDTLRALLGQALMPCPIAATWLGLALAQRQLFESPELLLWRTSPIAGWRGAVQVLLRACFVTLSWATALAVPFVLTLLSRTAAAPPLAWALVPLAVIGCTVPLLCTLLTMQIALIRFFSGPLLRLVLATLAALAALVFWVWLLVGLFAPANAGLQPLLAPASPNSMPWTIACAATLLSSAATGTLDVASLQALLGWIALGGALVAVGACLHPRAVERHQESQPPLLRQRRSSWPANLAAVVRRKEFAQVLQQPGALIGFLLFGMLVFALVRERVLVGAILADHTLLPEVAQLGAMTMLWFLAVLLVLYAHMGRLALWDGAQWTLWTTAPASPWRILRGKLEAVAILLSWPLVLVAVIGSNQFGTNVTTTLTFVGTAVGGTLVALGVLAIVGTSPRLMRPEDGGQIVQGGRTFVAAMLLVIVFYVALLPAVPAWLWLRANVHTPAALRDAAPWIVGGAMLLGAVVALLGIAIGTRNFRRLTAAR